MSEPEELREVKTGRFLPGTRGGPGRGHVTPTTKPFIQALEDAWQRYGEDVIERVVEKEPATFLKICASLVPRELILRNLNETRRPDRAQIEQEIQLLEHRAATRNGQ